MAIPTYIEAANAIADAPLETRIAALKHLKNLIIGHQDKKEELVRHGILEQLVSLLQETSKSRGKRKDQKTANGHAAREPTRASFTRGDDVRLQAILLISSFAQAGPAFVPPLLANSAIPWLLDAASISENYPRISTAALKALDKIAEVAQRGIRVFDPPAYKSFLDSLYTSSGVRAYSQILADVVPNEDRAIRTQIRLVCHLIYFTCEKDHHRDALVAGGVLDLLSARLSAYYIQHYPPENVSDAQLSSLSPMLPAMNSETLPHILGAIKAIVTDSNYRIARLLTSPLSRDAFLMRDGNNAAAESETPINPADHCLARFPSRTERSQSQRSQNFPTLGSLRPAATSDLPQEMSSESNEETHPSAQYQTNLTSWLLATIKTTRKAPRTEAAALLTVLYSSGLFKTINPRLFSNLVVPYLYEVITEVILEKDVFLTVPRTVLVQLIDSNSRLQKAVSDAGIIAKIHGAVQATFKHLTADPLPWSPTTTSAARDASLPPTRRLGHAGLSRQVHLMFGHREIAFNLMAAMSTHQDEYRKPFYDHGTTNYIALGLKPLDEEMLKKFENTNETITSGYRTINTAEIGNPIPVLRAACRAAQMMSRSVALLRTALTDAKLASPIVNLLKHDDMEVRKAASDVAINITNETSPMREDLIAEGIAKLLVDHAHSADPQLRIRSLWAIKNLVHRCPKKLRATIFEDLEPGWLAQTIIGNDTLLEPSSGREQMGIKEERMTDVIGGSNGDHLLSEDDYGTTALSIIGYDDQTTENDQTTRRTRTIAERVKASVEQARQMAVINTEIEIQRHAADALRNIITAYDGPDMLDTVFSSIGNNEIFEMFSRKLHEHMPDHPLVSHQNQQQAPIWGSSTPAVGPDPSSRYQSEGRRRFTSSAMLQSTILALTHITAGAPRYRQMVLSQAKTIMQPLLHLLSHPEGIIRGAVVSLIQNLAWIDDSADIPSARQRAQELLRQGFVSKMAQMQDDPLSDIQQRVKVARLNMQQALDNTGRGTEQLHTLDVPGDMSMGSARRNR